MFGTVEVRAPRFLPCRCAVTQRHVRNPVAEIVPDRCTPEYERIVAKMGALLPYGRARTLLAEFLPLGDVPAAETTRRRTMRVGACLERQAVQPSAPAAEARAIALSIDGGHVRSVRSYRGHHTICSKSYAKLPGAGMVVAIQSFVLHRAHLLKHRRRASLTEDKSQAPQTRTRGVDGATT